MARQPSHSILFLRSLLFWIGFVSLLTLFAVLLTLSFPLPFNQRFHITRAWSRSTIAWLELTCKLSYEIEGLEHIGTPGIVLAKHQSTWETLTLNLWFSPQSWVIKRELMWVPVFGWGTYLMQSIALNRNAGKKAMEQLVEQGKDRLDKGRWVIIFPEGTRIAPGKKGRYRMGGAILAERTGYPITPVAHNAGEYWPRRKFIKQPGVIKVSIGKPLPTQGKSAAELLAEAERWIETEMTRITSLEKHSYGQSGSQS